MGDTDPLPADPQAWRNLGSFVGCLFFLLILLGALAAVARAGPEQVAPQVGRMVPAGAAADPLRWLASPLMLGVLLALGLTLAVVSRLRDQSRTNTLTEELGENLAPGGPLSAVNPDEAFGNLMAACQAGMAPGDPAVAAAVDQEQQDRFGPYFRGAA